jgi:hypothetical protein
LQESFLNGLHAAFDATHDPATKAAAQTSAAALASSWRLHAIETEGFGGLNIWNSKPFRFEFDTESHLIEGPNGSGKSSLTGAITWALTGERPRDQAPTAPHIPKPVFGATEQTLGEWPPLATYPPSTAALKGGPKLRVTLTFRDDNANAAKIERRLNGTEVELDWDTAIQVPPVLIETGLSMPARLASLKLNEHKGDLTEAVQKLTGLDDLVAIGALCEGLCHASREYRSFKKKDLATATSNFSQAIARARQALDPVSVPVDNFVPPNTKQPDGAMAQFGIMLNAKAQELTSVVANDLAATLDLSKIAVQNDVVASLAAAKADVSAGLLAFPTWKSLIKISSAITPERRTAILSAITSAIAAAQEAELLRQKGIADSRFQLKALAAQWHSSHGTGSLEDCPLCLGSLSADPALVEELDSLKQTGEAASRSHADNINRVAATLAECVPETLRNMSAKDVAFEPASALVGDGRRIFCENTRYSETLVTLASRVHNALSNSPVSVPAPESAAAAQIENQTVKASISTLERMLRLADWHGANGQFWENWWHDLAFGPSLEAAQSSSTEPNLPEANKKPEALKSLLDRLSDALQKAEPYRNAAKHLREAWKEGVEAVRLQEFIDQREAVSDVLQPLKLLGNLSDSIARDAIQQLSSRMGEILEDIHLTESLRYREARLVRKEGLVVRAGFKGDMRIDATLVANTSWLRAVLWSFILALREEAVTQQGHDPFPVLILDDPQATFDFTHRIRWAQHVAGMQSASQRVQVILASYDETFLYFLGVHGVGGRGAKIVSAKEDVENVVILEGGVLDRAWDDAKQLKTAEGGRTYMSKARVYVESMLKLMLRDEVPKLDDSAVGACRAHIVRLQSKGGVSPWNRPDMHELVKHLDRTKFAAIKYMEIAHHSDGAHLGMGEAKDSKEHLAKLLPILDKCFLIARTLRALHGGQKALHKPAPIVKLPEGYRDTVAGLPLQIWGRAAALSDGKSADGLLNVDEFAATLLKKMTLAQHDAFVLNASTLDPVARPGDILLVHEGENPPVNSLVCAIDHDKILARRFALASNDSDVAVLSAQTINPHGIAPPVVAHRSTLHLRQIIGVLYRPDSLDQGVPTQFEVAECKGAASISSLGAQTLGLVEVVGRSAEPFALDGQYLLVRKRTGTDSLQSLEGKPVIAGDTDGNRYFKRLRVTADRIVLESLDVGGDHGPVVLHHPGGSGNAIADIWVVIGVLFELPSQKK